MSNIAANRHAVASWWGRPISPYLLLLLPALIALLNAIPIRVWQIAYAQTEMRRSFDIDGIVFHIPTSIPWKSFINTASGEQTLELFVPPKEIKTEFADVQGHKIQLLLLTIRTDKRRLGSIDAYIEIMRGKTPTMLDGYRLYPAGGFDFYVPIGDSRPHFFWCEVKGVGVLEGQPRICQVKEDIDELTDFTKGLNPVSVEYGFTFDDVPNLQKIDGDIRTLLRSMLTVKN